MLPPLPGGVEVAREACRSHENARNGPGWCDHLPRAVSRLHGPLIAPPSRIRVYVPTTGPPWTLQNGRCVSQMPALPNVPNVLRINLNMKMSADNNVVNILHVAFTGTSTNALLDTYAGDVRAAFGAHLAGLLSNDLTLLSVNVTDLTSPTAPVGFDGTSTACSGGAGALSEQACFLFNHHIARRYRGGKPRTYLAGPRDANLGADDRTWDGTFRGTLEAAFQAFVNAIEAVTHGTLSVGVLVNVSYFAGFTVVINPITGRARNVPSLRPGGPVVDEITATTLNPHVATQRRRALT